MTCQGIKCKDLDADGKPAWCLWAGCPVKAAVAKCPKVTGNTDGRKICPNTQKNIIKKQKSV
jgi:hypothetical protein